MTERHEMQLVISDEYGDIYECPICKRVLWFYKPDKPPEVVNVGNDQVIHVGGKGGLFAERTVSQKSDKVLN